MGLVFGDIGTSPIYTLTVIFALTPPTRQNVLGILSLVFWTMTLLVTVEYAWLAMSLGRKGQGGEIVLREILIRLLKKGKLLAFGGLLSFIGVSLLLGDGVITPAISILSAVEGLLLIPGMEGLNRGLLVLFAACIAVGLFVFQYKGTDRVAGTFGPIMVVWFAALTVSGVVSIASMPDVITAISPHHAIGFFRHHGLSGFVVLSEVILCSTGGEALYADMGHLGRRPITRAWYFVFVALIINYLGQGAFVMQHPGTKNILFGMLQSQAPFLYIPFLLLALMATVIASQAIISGVFSIVYQGITTRLMPLMRVDYTSTTLKSQIYIGFINWALMCAVIFIMILFQKSSNLAAAYGMAVTGSMTITSIMMIIVFSRTQKKWKAPLAFLIFCIDLVYLCSTFTKIPHGAYWSIILASFPFLTIILWRSGQRNLYLALRPLDIDDFLPSYEQIYKKGKIAGTGLFFTRESHIIPPYVIHCMIRSNIVYERNVLISIIATEDPFGVKTHLQKDLGSGLDAFEIRAGYMEVIDIENLLKMNGIKEKVIFYGVEDISTSNPLWSVFSVIKKLAPNFVQFHKLPASKLQGVVTRVEM
jgi:KUP system potassium uptake protein